jgi:hypothetical protein
MGNLVGRTAKMGTSLIDKTKRFRFGGRRALQRATLDRAAGADRAVRAEGLG